MSEVLLVCFPKLLQYKRSHLLLESIEIQFSFAPVFHVSVFPFDEMTQQNPMSQI